VSAPHQAEAARRDAVDTLPISEVFHHTIQGEGPAAGAPASFVRLMGCNLSCSWCDTPYTWDASRVNLRDQTTHRTAESIAAECVREHRGGGVVVITGGEPLLHQDRPAFIRLLTLLLEHDIPIHIETNGTIAPNSATLAYARGIIVSPKLPHAGPHRGHQDPRVAEDFRPWPNVFLKIVCQDAGDVARAVELADALGVPKHRTFVMPEGTTADDLALIWPEIADAAAQHGVNASHRLHVLAWGDERGR
jgi:7-carboxy-7-deazaguanine synthase